MAYLGKGLGSLTTANITVDKMTGDGSDTTLTLTLAQGVSSVNDVSVFISGVMQRPGTDYTLSGSTLTFINAPGNGLQVVAVSHGDSALDNVADATAITASFDSDSVPDSAISGLSSSKLTGALTGAATNLTSLNAAQLTGALPALSAANLTGISSYTKSASDPAADTNPSGGTGSVWVNSTSGETYVCTDATTDENVWTNVGGGTGDIQPWIYQGSVSGYTGGGSIGSGSTNNTTSIEKYSLVSASTSGSVANLTYSRADTIGSCGETHSYWVEPHLHGIERTSYASDTHDSSLTALVSSGGAAIYGAAGEWSSIGYGYVIGGWRSPHVNDVDKYSTVNDTNSTASGDLSEPKGNAATSTDGSYGYAAGGSVQNTSASVRIERMSWATEVNSGSIGSLISGGNCVGGISSLTHGYINSASDITNGVIYTNFQKYAFASSGITTSSAATLANARGQNSVASSVTAGFIAKGANSSNSQTNQVKTFLFASDTTITDVGTLSQPGREAASSHT